MRHWVILSLYKPDDTLLQDSLKPREWFSFIVPLPNCSVLAPHVEVVTVMLVEDRTF